MISRSHWILIVLLATLSGCASHPDVQINGPTLTMDTTNAIFPVLAKALPAHPKDNSFRLTWSITPNPKKPLESLAHYLIYNRSTQTLEVHRDQPQFEQYSGVTDAIIKNLASRKGSVTDLVRAGCKSQTMPEK